MPEPEPKFSFSLLLTTAQASKLRRLAQGGHRGKVLRELIEKAPEEAPTAEAPQG